ncbi:unnamed protein product [Meloidogyne enterolobii]|uniref:Uncharacterized protein n=1 Tax=Meloidogyne enterolobii TaxID=390850 RepID=A0ACB1AY21_MELEN
MSSKSNRSKDQREQAIHVDASTDETNANSTSSTSLNAHLIEVRVNEEVVERKEKESLATIYKVEIEELRKQLEYSTRDKAKYLDYLLKLRIYYLLRLQIEHDMATSGYEELKSRIPHLEQEFKKAKKGTPNTGMLLLVLVKRRLLLLFKIVNMNVQQKTIKGLLMCLLVVEETLRRAHEDAEIQLQQRDEKIAQLKDEIQRLSFKYQDLLDLKVKLDTELNEFHRICDQEDARSGITPLGTPNTATTSNLSAPLSSTRVVLRSSTSVFNGNGSGDDSMIGSQRGTKRRLNQEDLVSIGQSTQKWTSSGDAAVDVIIDEHDTDGKFIRLYNKGDETISVGNWVVRSTAGGIETTFKFPSRAKILPGKHATIWSSNANAEHQPPNSYVMKNPVWPHGRCICTELLNPDLKVYAWRKSVLGIQNGSDADKNCIIM